MTTTSGDVWCILVRRTFKSIVLLQPKPTEEKYFEFYEFSDFSGTKDLRDFYFESHYRNEFYNLFCFMALKTIA